MSDEKKIIKLTCIVCPIGCEIEVTVKGKRIISLGGNKCPRGESYAREEATQPKRIVFSVLRCKNGDFPTVAVKTSKPILKSLIPNLMKLLSNLEVSAPLKIGDVVASNILNSGADVVVTRNVTFSQNNMHKNVSTS